MKFVIARNTNQTKVKSKDTTVRMVILGVLLASIVSVMTVSIMAVQEVAAEPRIPQKDSKMQRDAQTKMDGGSAFKTEKKSGDSPPTIDPKTGDPLAPIVTEPELPPPPPICDSNGKCY